MLPSLRNILEVYDPFRGKRPLPKEIPKRVVIIRTDRIGDHVVFGGALEAFAKAWPQTRISMVAPENQRDMYKHCPYVHEYIGVVEHDRKSRAKAYKQINRAKPEWLINFLASRSRISDRIMRYCYAPVRVGWSRLNDGQEDQNSEYYDRFYTHQFLAEWPTSLRDWEKNRRLLGHLGIDAPKAPPTVWTGQEDVAAAQRIYAEAKFRPEETVVCFLGASNSTRTPPQLKPAIIKLMQEFKFNVIMVGAAADHTMSVAPVDVPEELWLNLCGKTTVQQTAELMRLCRLVIGVDSGPAHLASAVHAPHVIAMHGMNIGRFLPANRETSLVLNPLGCYLCYQKCVFEETYCLTSLPYTLFRQAVADAWAGKSERARVYRPVGKFLEKLRPDAVSKWDPSWVEADSTEVIEVPVSEGPGQGF